MHGKTQIKFGDKIFPLHFNNFSKVELGKLLLKQEGVFQPKPEEMMLLEAIDKMAKENHLLLLCRIIYAGIVGERYAKDEPMLVTKADISELVSEASEEDLYNCWSCFLESMGMNLDSMIKANQEVSESKKKANP